MCHTLSHVFLSQPCKEIAVIPILEEQGWAQGYTDSRLGHSASLTPMYNHDVVYSFKQKKIKRRKGIQEAFISSKYLEHFFCIKPTQTVFLQEEKSRDEAGTK